MTDYKLTIKQNTGLVDGDLVVAIVNRLQDVVSDWRDYIQAIDPQFQTPDKVNAARFVDTEGSEVCDAFLRLADWSRNGNRNADVNDEVGDFLFMLVSTLTAMGGSMSYIDPSVVPQNPSVDELVGFGNNVFNDLVLGWWVPQPDPVPVAIYAVIQYCAMNELNPIDLVNKRLERIANKRRQRLERHGSGPGRRFAPTEDWGD